MRACRSKLVGPPEKVGYSVCLILLLVALGSCHIGPVALPTASELSASGYDGFGSCMLLLPPSTNSPGRRLLVGCPWTTRKDIVDTGAVWEISLGSGLSRPIFAGTEAHARAGTAIALMADCDGDGIPDIAVGCPGAEEDGKAGIGRVVILSGTDYRVVRTLHGAPGSWRFGMALVSAYQPEEAVPGPLVVFNDTKEDHCTGLVAFDPRSLVPRWSTASMGGFSNLTEHCLLALPDIDGDGMGDIGIGAPWSNHGSADVWGSGCLRLLSGTSGREIKRLWGRQPGEMYGSSACGYSTGRDSGPRLVLIGAPGFKNEAGQCVGRACVVDLESDQQTRQFVGDTDRAEFGRAVAIVSRARNADGGVGGLLAAIGLPNWSLGSGCVECFSIDSGERECRLTGVNQGNMLGTLLSSAFPLGADQTMVLLVGGPGSYSSPGVRYKKGRSVACSLSLATPVRVDAFSVQGRLDDDAQSALIRLEVP